MGVFDGVKTNKLNGGLGRSNPTDDGIGLLAYVVALASLPAGQVHYTPKLLLQPADADTLGFDAAFDANEGILFNHAVTEFFRLSPEGQLWIMPIPAAITPTVVATNAAFLAGVRTASTAKFIAMAGFTYTAAQMATYVEGVQGAINTLALEHRLIDAVILEGKGDVTVTAIADYVDLRAKNAPTVSISIAQDGGIADLDAAYKQYADVGAVLGMISVRKVSENLGSVDIEKKPDAFKADPDYPLNSDTLWAEARLSDGTKVSDLSSADMEALNTKGYIFAGNFQSYPGTYFSDSPTAVELKSDYCRIENNRTWNKAARGIRTALMPRVKGKLKKDAATGYIRSTAITQLTNIAKKPLQQMVDNDEISGYDVYINPKQIVNDTTPLSVKASVVMDDIIHEIDVDLGLANKIS